MEKQWSLKEILNILCLLQLLVGAALPQEEDFLLFEASGTVPAPTPIPTPPPDQPFMNYTNTSLYMFIQDIKIELPGYAIHTADLVAMQNTSFMPEIHGKLQFTTSYYKLGKEEFELTFWFTREIPPTDDKDRWHLSSFQHQNFTEGDEEVEDRIYQYTGPVHTIVASIGVRFNCSTVEFYGTATSESETYNSKTSLKGLSVQPFLEHGTISPELISCTRTSQSDNGGLPLPIIVGVVVGICVVIAAIVTAVMAILIKKYRRRGSYDLLSD